MYSKIKRNMNYDENNDIKQQQQRQKEKKEKKKSRENGFHDENKTILISVITRTIICKNRIITDNN